MNNQQQQAVGQPSPAPSKWEAEQALLQDLLAGKAGSQGAMALAHEYGLNVREAAMVVNWARRASE